MMVVRVTAETETGFVHEIGQYKDITEALEETKVITAGDPVLSRSITPEEKSDWWIKMQWVNNEIPW